MAPTDPSFIEGERRDHAGQPTAIRCDQCGESVPALEYCVRCGDPLAAEVRRGAKGRLRQMYAAAPDERRDMVHIVSTMYPALPREEMRAFRVALVAGFSLVVALGALGFFPVAMLVATIVVPLVTVIYVVDVDLYEDEPIRVVAFTFVWGALAGALFAWALGVILPEGVASAALRPSDGGFSVPVARAIIAPLMAGALMLAGPLLLLRQRRFNDALDGATFGVASAVAFTGAQTLVTSISLFESGLRPVGDPLPWVLLLLGFGVAMPLIAAGAIGGLAGAIWLRYRAPAHGVIAPGIIGQPMVAAVLAGVLLVAAALAQALLTEIAALVVLSLLALVALLWLRRAIHVGLLQESREIAIGAPIRCGNCGRMTPAHTFCGVCGVSLRALPKTPSTRATNVRMDAGTASPDAASATIEGSGRTRLGHRGVLLVFGTVLVGVALAGGAIAYLATRGSEEPECPDPTMPCPSARAPLGDWTPLVGASLDYGFEYNPRLWSLDHSEAGFELLTGVGFGAILQITVVPAGESDVPNALESDRAWAAEWISALQRDTEPQREFVGNPVLGHRVGSSGLYGGVGIASQGMTGNWTVAIVSASDGVVTAVASLWVTDGDRIRGLRAADQVVNSFVWPTDPAGLAALETAATTADDTPDPDLPARGLAPRDLAVAYDYVSLWDAGITGQDAKVAILQFGTDTDEDLAVFDAKFGIDGPVPERIPVDDGLADRDTFTERFKDAGDAKFSSFSSEAALDTQAVRAVAPGAKILVFGAPLGGWVQALDAIVQDGRARIVTVSYGFCYSGLAASSNRGLIADFEQGLADAAAHGISVFIASGDSGAYACHRLDLADHSAAPGWPDCAPDAISVGGTQLEVGPEGAYLRETGWQEYLSSKGTGGGISPVAPRPDWQAGVPGVDNAVTDGHRQCPDVAAAADPDSGYLVYRTDPVSGVSKWVTSGGTSGAAPFWAGVMALVEQLARQEGIALPDDESLAPLLYRVAASHPEAFHDVQRGGNLLQPAGVGWDYATGLGSPDVAVLARAMIEELRD